MVVRLDGMTQINLWSLGVCLAQQGSFHHRALLTVPVVSLAGQTQIRILLHHAKSVRPAQPRMLALRSVYLLWTFALLLILVLMSVSSVCSSGQLRMHRV